MSNSSRRKVTVKATSKSFTEEDINDKLIKARVEVITTQPFFGVLALHLQSVRQDSVETAATNGKRFLYNAEFINSQSVAQVAWIYSHEILHVAFEHPFSIGDRTAEWVYEEETTVTDKDGKKRKVKNIKRVLVANIAMDLVINLILVDNNVPGMPKGALLDEKWRGMCWQEVYDELIKESKTMSDKDMQKMINGVVDSHIDSSGEDVSPEEREKLRRDIRDNLRSAALAAGTVPKGMDILINEINQPRVDWRSVVLHQLYKHTLSDYTFERRSKKSATTQFFLPSQKETPTLEVAIMLDASGSCVDYVKEFLSEIYGIIGLVDDYKVTVWSYDTECYNLQQFSPSNIHLLSKYQVKGGGGTDFMSNYRFMESNNIRPNLLINFTDGVTIGSWGDALLCDTIFCIKNSKKLVAPFGITVQLD